MDLKLKGITTRSGRRVPRGPYNIVKSSPITFGGALAHSFVATFPGGFLTGRWFPQGRIAYADDTMVWATEVVALEDHSERIEGEVW